MIRFHTYKNGKARHPAFLDDYAYLIQACIHLQEITGMQSYLFEAKKLTEFVITHFSDDKGGFFYFTHKEQEDVITRKVEFYDGAVPSGNSVMADNLFYLSVVFDIPGWNERSQMLARQVLPIVEKYPTSFGVWAMGILKQVEGMNELVVAGNAAWSLTKDLLKLYIPNKVLQWGNDGYDLPLFRSKPSTGQGLIYLCKDYSCRQPVSTIDDLKLQLRKTSH